VLSEGGLEPALKALARRSAIPVELDQSVGARLPERVEVAAYHVASEALTNATKHARASTVVMQAGQRDGTLHLSINETASVAPTLPAARGSSVWATASRPWAGRSQS
jgi:signal transduction histidine kinase